MTGAFYRKLSGKCGKDDIVNLEAIFTAELINEQEKGARSAKITDSNPYSRRMQLVFFPLFSSLTVRHRPSNGCLNSLVAVRR